jgi:hypothetical protein
MNMKYLYMLPKKPVLVLLIALMLNLCSMKLTFRYSYWFLTKTPPYGISSEGYIFE